MARKVFSNDFILNGGVRVGKHSQNPPGVPEWFGLDKASKNFLSKFLDQYNTYDIFKNVITLALEKNDRILLLDSANEKSIQQPEVLEGYSNQKVILPQFENFNCNETPPFKLYLIFESRQGFLWAGLRLEICSYFSAYNSHFSASQTNYSFDQIEIVEALDTKFDECHMVSLVKLLTCLSREKMLIRQIFHLHSYLLNK